MMSSCAYDVIHCRLTQQTTLGEIYTLHHLVLVLHSSIHPIQSPACARIYNNTIVYQGISLRHVSYRVRVALIIILKTHSLKDPKSPTSRFPQTQRYTHKERERERERDNLVLVKRKKIKRGERERGGLTSTEWPPAAAAAVPPPPPPQRQTRDSPGRAWPGAWLRACRWRCCTCRTRSSCPSSCRLRRWGTG
jgi:hypothetical protein